MNKGAKRTKKSDREMVAKLDYKDIKHPVSRKDYRKIETKNNIGIDVFGYENKRVYLIYRSKKNYKNQVDLLLIENKDICDYVYIKN